jgi:hypothetical protein
MQQLSPNEIEEVAGGFPGLGLIVCGPVVSAAAQAVQQIINEQQQQGS